MRRTDHGTPGAWWVGTKLGRGTPRNQRPFCPSGQARSLRVTTTTRRRTKVQLAGSNGLCTFEVQAPLGYGSAMSNADLQTTGVQMPDGASLLLVEDDAFVRRALR